MIAHRKLTIAILVIGALSLALLMSGCSGDGGPDLTPLGNGLAFIGLGIVLAALIRVLGNQWTKPSKPIERREDEERQ